MAIKRLLKMLHIKYFTIETWSYELNVDKEALRRKIIENFNLRDKGLKVSKETSDFKGSMYNDSFIIEMDKTYNKDIRGFFTQIFGTITDAGKGEVNITISSRIKPSILLISFASIIFSIIIAFLNYNDFWINILLVLVINFIAISYGKVDGLKDGELFIKYFNLVIREVLASNSANKSE